MSRQMIIQQQLAGVVTFTAEHYAQLNWVSLQLLVQQG